MANLNGHETGNGGHRQADINCNSPFVDPASVVFFCSSFKYDQIIQDWALFIPLPEVYIDGCLQF